MVHRKRLFGQGTWLGRSGYLAAKVCSKNQVLLPNSSRQVPTVLFTPGLGRWNVHVTILFATKTWMLKMTHFADDFLLKTLVFHIHVCLYQMVHGSPKFGMLWVGVCDTSSRGALLESSRNPGKYRNVLVWANIKHTTTWATEIIWKKKEMKCTSVRVLMLGSNPLPYKCAQLHIQRPWFRCMETTKNINVCLGFLRFVWMYR